MREHDVELNWSSTSVISSSSSISRAAELSAESPPKNSVSTMLRLCCRHCCRTPASKASNLQVKGGPCLLSCVQASQQVELCRSQATCGRKAHALASMDDLT